MTDPIRIRPKASPERDAWQINDRLAGAPQWAMNALSGYSQRADGIYTSVSFHTSDTPTGQSRPRFGDYLALDPDGRVFVLDAQAYANWWEPVPVAGSAESAGLAAELKAAAQTLDDEIGSLSTLRGLLEEAGIFSIPRAAPVDAIGDVLISLEGHGDDKGMPELMRRAATALERLSAPVPCEPAALPTSEQLAAKDAEVAELRAMIRAAKPRIPRHIRATLSERDVRLTYDSVDKARAALPLFEANVKPFDAENAADLEDVDAELRNARMRLNDVRALLFDAGCHGASALELAQYAIQHRDELAAQLAALREPAAGLVYRVTFPPDGQGYRPIAYYEAAGREEAEGAVKRNPGATITALIAAPASPATDTEEKP